jgi:hypothetical protein
LLNNATTNHSGSLLISLSRPHLAKIFVCLLLAE